MQDFMTEVASVVSGGRVSSMVFQLCYDVFSLKKLRISEGIFVNLLMASSFE